MAASVDGAVKVRFKEGIRNSFNREDLSIIIELAVWPIEKIGSLKKESTNYKKDKRNEHLEQLYDFRSCTQSY